MNTKRPWVFFLLLTSVSSNPVMKYSFCPLSDPQCEPSNFGSDSPLEFGNITSGVYYYELIERKPLVVSCTFHEPLHWILTAFKDTRVSSISNTFATNGSHLLYYYSIHVHQDQYGLIRCESYNDSKLAAEIYIARRNKAIEFIHREYKIRFFYSTPPRRGGQLIVPCRLYQFGPSFDVSTIRLKKLRQSDMLASKVTPACFNCFPRDEQDPAKCITSCPYNISERLWTEAGQPLGVNKTANQWLDCTRDPECAFKTVTTGPKFENTDCNGDDETTCSDHISAISLYPSKCGLGGISNVNFIKVEACLVKNLAQSLEPAEAEYDPRIGFRLKTERDLDAVYICSSNTSAIYLSTYNLTKKIKAHLDAASNNTNGHLKGIYCVVSQKWMENVRLELVHCSTLFECELQLETYEGGGSFRTSNSVVRGEKISTNYPDEFGQIIRNPPSSGVARCSTAYRLKTGYISDLQYFFTGLDSKIYFVSNGSVPVEEVISMEKVETDLTTSTGSQIEVECTVATFIVHPSFEFMVDYSNGTSRKTDRISGLQRRNEGSHSALHILKRSADDEASVVSVRCRAPYRNSGQEAEATLLMDTLAVERDQKEKIIIDNNSSQVYLVVILTVTIGFILLASIACAIYCVRKHKNSTVQKELRQLTLEEIYDFLNGNAALATGSRNEVNFDGIGFPECFQIPAMDLRMHMQEILGEGEFGRCVSGHFHDQKVAVKTTKTSMDVEAFKEFLREVKIMAYLGKHENIIEFLGAVVDQLKDRICIAVVELSPYGDLLSYLRKHGRENPDDVNLYANLTPEEPVECSEGTKLRTNHLSHFCEQIASAMEFVVAKRVIHGDLAARNVLVFPDYVVKITDFGLSRKLYTASNYKKKTVTPLPWRWMAVESLKYMEFSPMTDMWAYGVTAFEIFTMGEVPYTGTVYSREFVDKLDGGWRLQRPKYVSEEIYQFMKLTWDRIPCARPSFEEAKVFFSRLSIGIH